MIESLNKFQVENWFSVSVQYKQRANSSTQCSIRSFHAYAVMQRRIYGISMLTAWTHMNHPLWMFDWSSFSSSPSHRKINDWQNLCYFSPRKWFQIDGIRDRIVHAKSKSATDADFSRTTVKDYRQSNPTDTDGYGRILGRFWHHINTVYRILYEKLLDCKY